jgi:hypothetical protein
VADPVQSIRVASALLGRFPGLMKQAAGTSSEVELAIGEANQLYPEIWRHLDDARRELGDRDTSIYDALRATVLAALGVTEIETHATEWYTRYGTYAGTTLHKVVSFNDEGYQRARDACRALMAVMPEVDWRELAREDVRAIAEAGSLHSAKYKTAIKIAAIGAGLALATFAVYAVVSRPTTDDVSEEDAAAMRARSAEREVQTRKRAEALDAKRARIDVLRASIKATCQPAELSELVKLLREEGQLTDAKNLEGTPCIPARPRCSPLPGGLLDRLAATHERVLAAPAGVHCQGILTAGTPLVPALAVWFVDGGNLVRGVVSADGTQDLVPFSVAPGQMLVAHGDLDDDGTDEALFATDRDLWVTRIANGAFVDIRGPRAARRCQTTLSIERDQRPDQHTGDLLVITVLDTKGCAGERRSFRLVSGELVED